MEHLEKLIEMLRKWAKYRMVHLCYCLCRRMCQAIQISHFLLCFLSALWSKLDIIFDKVVCCVGHNKSIVDAINDKTIRIYSQIIAPKILFKRLLMVLLQAKARH